MKDGLRLNWMKQLKQLDLYHYSFEVSIAHQYFPSVSRETIECAHGSCFCQKEHFVCCAKNSFNNAWLSTACLLMF